MLYFGDYLSDFFLYQIIPLIKTISEPGDHPGVTFFILFQYWIPLLWFRGLGGGRGGVMRWGGTPAFQPQLSWGWSWIEECIGINAYFDVLAMI